VSRLVTSHFHITIAERIGETDGINVLDRYGKALKKEKCLSWVVSVSRDSMAQCRNEVRTDQVNRTELRLTGDGKEIMIACNFNIQSSFISYTWYMLRANIVSIYIQNKLRTGSKI